MYELASFDWGELLEMPTLIFLVGGVIAITAIVADQWRRAQKTSDEARLKEQMIQRGFSADEIERVIKTGASRPPDGACGKGTC
jgi:hypothetical protein